MLLKNTDESTRRGEEHWAKADLIRVAVYGDLNARNGLPISVIRGPSVEGIHSSHETKGYVALVYNSRRVAVHTTLPSFFGVNQCQRSRLQ